MQILRSEMHKALPWWWRGHDSDSDLLESTWHRLGVRTSVSWVYKVLTCHGQCPSDRARWESMLPGGAQLIKSPHSANWVPGVITQRVTQARRNIKERVKQIRTKPSRNLTFENAPRPADSVPVVFIQLDDRSAATWTNQKTEGVL